MSIHICIYNSTTNVEFVSSYLQCELFRIVFYSKGTNIHAIYNHSLHSEEQIYFGMQINKFYEYKIYCRQCSYNVIKCI